MKFVRAVWIFTETIENSSPDALVLLVDVDIVKVERNGLQLYEKRTKSKSLILPRIFHVLVFILPFFL